jgi:hypothetical protein
MMCACPVRGNCYVSYAGIGRVQRVIEKEHHRTFRTSKSDKKDVGISVDYMLRYIKRVCSRSDCSDHKRRQGSFEIEIYRYETSQTSPLRIVSSSGGNGNG